MYSLSELTIMLARSLFETGMSSRISCKRKFPLVYTSVLNWNNMGKIYCKPTLNCARLFLVFRCPNMFFLHRVPYFCISSQSQ